MFLTLHFLSSGSVWVLFQGELIPTLPEKSEGEREKKWEGESSKVTFGVSPLELVSSWQGRDSFNFSSTVRSSLFFKRLWDRYKQRKILPDFFGIIWGPLSSQALSLCQKWAFSDSCQISAADGLLGSQIEQSFPRYCKSRPGCFSTCFCPSVIDKSYWMTVWQTPHLWFLVEWARKKTQKESSDCSEVPEVLRVELSLTTSSIKSTVKESCSSSRCDEDMDQRALMWHYGHLHLALLTSILLLLLLFCETIRRGVEWHVKSAFRGFDAKGKWKLQRK